MSLIRIGVGMIFSELRWFPPVGMAHRKYKLSDNYVKRDFYPIIMRLVN